MATLDARDFVDSATLPPQGCAWRLRFGAGAALGGVRLGVANAAWWRIPELDVEQGHFQHQGFEGTLQTFLERVRAEIEEARQRYPKESWKNFDEFLQNLDEVLSGTGTLTLDIRDPSGLSHIDAALQPEWEMFERSVRDDWALGVQYPRPAVQGTDAASVAKLVRRAQRIVALTGAGVSVESGVTPFRRAGGGGTAALWEQFDPKKMTVKKFNGDPEVQAAWWSMERKLMAELRSAEPNPAHKFFGMLEEQGKLHGIITQNIDSLHQKGGVPDSKVNELHGHLRRVICANQRSRLNPEPFSDGGCDLKPLSFEDVDADVAVPSCPKCGAPLRSETVMFEQPMPEGAVETARLAVQRCDLLLVVGSTLLVSPANELPAEALRRGVPVVLVNFGETRYDEQVHCLVRRCAGELFAEVHALLQAPELCEDEVPQVEVEETSTEPGRPTLSEDSEEEQLYGDDDFGA